MKVRTEFSVYQVDEGPGPTFRLMKIEDHWPRGGPHPHVSVGDYFVGTGLEVKVGLSLRLSGVSEHVHVSGRRCSNCHDQVFFTSTVQEILSQCD